LISCSAYESTAAFVGVFLSPAYSPACPPTGLTVCLVWPVSAFLFVLRVFHPVLPVPSILRVHLQGFAPRPSPCLPLSTPVYLCLPLSTSVYPCLPLSPSIYPCLPLSPPVSPCLPLSTPVYPSLPTPSVPLRPLQRQPWTRTSSRRAGRGGPCADGSPTFSCGP